MDRGIYEEGEEEGEEGEERKGRDWGKRKIGSEGKRRGLDRQMWWREDEDRGQQGVRLDVRV